MSFAVRRNGADLVFRMRPFNVRNSERLIFLVIQLRTHDRFKNLVVAAPDEPTPSGWKTLVFRHVLLY